MGAALLFLVQPMVGKMVLPRAGGSPQVWNTSLVFFQVALLLGYLYAHLSVRWLGVRRQAAVHLAVLALPVLALPIALPAGAPASGESPGVWVLGALALSVGLPFLVLSTASPLLQRWLASTDHEHAADPYFLYAGSNAGSLLGLLLFPLLLEPSLPLGVQTRLWTIGYAVFVALALACALVVLAAGRSPAAALATAGGAETAAQAAPAPIPPAAVDHATATPDHARDEPSGRDRLFWIASAGVPSMLLLGVTQYITSQIAPISLLWVLPLAIYLATFIVAFARRQVASPERLSRLLAIVCVVAALIALTRFVDPQWAVALLHLSVLGLGGLLCHVRLARARPATTHLTEYYLLISVGGALGGSVAALVAPVLFDFIAEYPIAVVLTCLFRHPFGGSEGDRGWRRLLFHGRALDVVLPAVLALWVFSAVGIARSLADVPDGVMVLLVAVLPCVVVFALSPRPVRFALGLAALLASAESGQMYRGEILHQDRTFFGVHRVARDPGNTVTVLYHGSTVHGVQSLDPARATEPLAYYHPTGPAGDVLSAFALQPDKRELALVGAGTGALAVLAGAHQRVTLFEIDPEVVWIAEESGLFTYVERARAEHEWVVGDGRIELQSRSELYDLIVLDAFSSGTIPVHLMTREAFEVYLSRLAPGGALLFHISNRHLGLAPVLAAHARDMRLAAQEWVDVRGDDDLERGIFGSHWVLMAPPHPGLAYVPAGEWRPIAIPRGQRAWTDDFSDLLSVQRWN